MSDPQIPADIPRTRTWVRVALGLSLALNLLIVGVIGGAVLSHGRQGPPVALAPGDFGPYSRALSEEDRAALRTALRAQAPRLRENRTAVRAGFKDLLTALRADPYDPARVSALLAAQQARVEDQAGLVRDLVLTRVAQMHSEERAAFADRLERVLRHGPPRDHGRDTDRR
ncbi:MAG: periplasmic heavy metal sensor [Rhodobacteraceae bacterium]|nr:periplasmic heavy metal sensor [Paracoccaceae bacterium]